ncbi:MAG: xanthine dehydrogenase family protein molybdopterin-binding subunit, partial [Candidatus Eremiobacteraeota bacterium]|nr:xanthine dehydrogenase family protein molybdopterin-binding subunit [Candidatus Eremiobacteraeota bacterium]
MIPLVGAPVDRVDGRLKVTGAAKYSAEVAVPNLAYGALVLSTVANGRIAAIEDGPVRRMPGVIDVMTPSNAPRVKTSGPDVGYPVLRVLQDDLVHYDRQPVALVIADTFERAIDAAAALRVRYSAAPPATRLDSAQPYKPASVHGKDADTRKGDATGALASAAV